MRERGFWKRDTRCGQSTSTSFISTGTDFPPIGAARCGMPTRWDCKRSTSAVAESPNTTAKCGGHCIQDVLRKTPQLDPREVEDVILGCGQPHGPQGHNIARVSAMLAGLPTSTGGVTVNRFCSSGLQSIALAAYQIMCGGSDALIGGGVESISLVQRN